MTKIKIGLILIHLSALVVYAGDNRSVPAKFQIRQLPQTMEGLNIERTFYGSADNVIITAGDANAAGAVKKLSLLQYADGKFVSAALPDLPQPRNLAAGTLLDDTVYIVAGLDGEQQGNPTTTLWSLKLPKARSDWQGLQWNNLAPLPGAARSEAVAVALNGKLYIFGGVDSNATLLKDAYCYKPGGGYTKIPDLPENSAAVSAAVPYGDSHIIVFAGNEVLAYHDITKTWIKMDKMPAGFSTTNALKINSGIILTGTEKSQAGVSHKIIKFDLLPHEKSFGWLNLTMLLGYLAALMLIGAFYAWKKKNTSDYFVGGQKIPWWAAGLSIFGTQLSSIAFMAIPAKVYATNWTYFTSVIAIVIVQPIVIYFYLPFFRQLKVASVYEYLEQRFNLALRMIASLSFILFQTGRMTIVLFLPALALSAVTGFNIYHCILLMGIVVTIYTTLGGIEAVVWTDVMQVVILIGAAIISVVVIILNINGGVGEVWRISTADNKLQLFDWNWDYTRAVFWVILVGSIFHNIISYTADQAVVQRYFITKDFKKTVSSIWTNGILVVPVSLAWFVIGTSLYCYYKTHPVMLDPTVKTDQIFPFFIAQEIPNGLVGLIIAGLFAAAQSTISGSMNSISTVISTDFYQRFTKNYSDTVSLNIARISSLLLGTMATSTALWMAANQDLITSLWDIYMMVLGLCMASVAGLFILGIFTKRTTAYGALTGAIAGAAVLYVFQQYTNANFFLYSFIGAVACVIVGYTASFVLPSSKKDITGLSIYSADLSNRV